MIFVCEDTERKDQHGRLDACGVNWTEARVWAEWVTIMVGGGVFGVGIVGGVIGLVVMLLGLSPLLFFIACGVVGGGVGLMWWGWRLHGTEHHLAFASDGKSLTPWRLSTGTHYKDKLTRSHSLIESIESEQLKERKKDDNLGVYTHGVIIFYTDGGIERIARNLETESAHMLAVRLNLALVKMRAELSATGSGGASRRVSGRRERLYVIN